MSAEQSNCGIFETVVTSKTNCEGKKELTCHIDQTEIMSGQTDIIKIGRLKEELNILSVEELIQRIQTIPLNNIDLNVEKSELVHILFDQLQKCSFTCAICLSEHIRSVDMPCCLKKGSSISFCNFCIAFLCARDRGRVGICPICRTYIKYNPFTEEITISSQPSDVRRISVGRCELCFRSQQRIVQDGICSACVSGASTQLRYECQGCHRVQAIPRPMWRFQDEPEMFGDMPWPCHVGCQDFTFWRIIPSDVENIPYHEHPENW
eukprot:CAMPEP_0196590022 /NCGR_PEP_ID=MMETSP1081-20130531/65294_1 /TAXON_ID=36882 /ORGANISM="Pyramimonas amylifera, Strain CCMP720" /LENGTH=264 /DNA_ID=CAMNT_0041912993 /DNA_START=151 /DNA_END=942 /DNA_ORIENTATION=+